MTEIEPLVSLVILTGLLVWWRTGSLLYGILGILLAPFLWYVGVFAAIAGLVLGFPVLYVVGKILF